jgi:hypothetical protein
VSGWNEWTAIVGDHRIVLDDEGWYRCILCDDRWKNIPEDQDECKP